MLALLLAVSGSSAAQTRPLTSDSIALSHLVRDAILVCAPRACDHFVAYISAVTGIDTSQIRRRQLPNLARVLRGDIESVYGPGRTASALELSVYRRSLEAAQHREDISADSTALLSSWFYRLEDNSQRPKAGEFDIGTSRLRVTWLYAMREPGVRPFRSTSWLIVAGLTPRQRTAPSSFGTIHVQYFESSISLPDTVALRLSKEEREYGSTTIYAKPIVVFRISRAVAPATDLPPEGAIVARCVVVGVVSISTNRSEAWRRVTGNDAGCALPPQWRSDAP